MQKILAILILVFSATSAFADSPLIVHFINVGQGDAIFVQSPGGQTMLIDGGENNGKTVKYLNAIGVKTINTLVITHPHLDHIGDLPEVVRNFDVKSVIMPRVTSVTTVTFEQLLKAVQAKGLGLTEGKAGLVINLDPAMTVECLAPNGAGYTDLNDFSVVLRVTYGDVSFLLTGDATAVSEKEMLQSQSGKLKSTVLKVGHHGSSSSTSATFLKEVAPQVAVISVGQGNSYGHPTQSVLNRLNGLSLFRTDQQGTILLVTDGKNLNAYGPPAAAAAQEETKTASPAPQPASADTVYVTRTGEKYHREGCRYLTTPIPLSREEAVKRYTPCAVCKP